MSDRGETRRRRDAEARTKEAAARLLGILRDYGGVRARVPIGACPPAAETVLRWCLLAEAVAEALDADGDEAGRVRRPTSDASFGTRARFHWAKLTQRWPEDPRWAAAADAAGLALPEGALRVRIGESAARFLRTLRAPETAGRTRRATHAACGPLDAADWAELLLAFAADAERRLLEASVSGGRPTR